MTEVGGWNTRRLDECVSFLSGGTPSKARNDYWGGTIPWVSSKELKTERIYGTDDLLTAQGAANGTRMVPAGTVLFVVRSMVLANRFPVSVAMRPVAFNQDIKAVVCGTQVTSSFMYYWLRANEYEILGRVDEAAHGTKRIQMDRLCEMLVDVPPLPVQRRIAGILSAYDDLIENCERRIRVLDEMARALYREWFVLFRYPGHAQTPLVDSPLGRIPKGWTVSNLGVLEDAGDAELQTGPFGTQLRASDYVEHGIPVINVRNIGYGAIRASTLEYLAPEQVKKHARHRLDAADIVFGRKGAVDRHVLIAEAQQGWIQGSDCIRLRLRTDLITTRLLSFGFREATHRDWMLRHCSGAATMASLNQDVLRRIPVVIPTPSVLAAFDMFASASLTQAGSLSAQADNLRKTRDLLLPRLLSGQLSVEDAV